MVDVNYEIDEYAAFPTMMYKFKAELPIDDMVKHIQSQKDKSNITQTESNLHKLEIFNPLVQCISHVASQIIQKLEYTCDAMEITNMWGNYLQKETAHPPHTHSNNVFSGVYYIDGDENSAPIQFFDPRPQANLLKPKNNPTWNNSGMLQFDATVGTGLIFPSWLMHWVPPTPSERTSVSWNIILRGDYGSKEEYQYAHI